MRPNLTKEVVTAAIEGFEEQKRRIDTQIASLRGQIAGEAAEPTAAPESRPRRKMITAARKRIAAAQRKRWAEAKGQFEPKAPAKPKRKLSAAGRAAIIAATKKRWAAKRAAER